MTGLPILIQQKKFKAVGYDNVFLLDLAQPFHVVPKSWSMQVTGLAADGVTNVAATSWTVNLQGSLDGIGYDGDATEAMLVNTSASEPDGTVEKSNNNFLAVRFVRIHCSALVLGAADSILVTVLGVM